MAVISSQVAVTSTAARLAESGGDGSLTLVRNAGTTDIFIGGAAVTTSNGFKLAATESLTVDLPSGEVLFVVAASTGTVQSLVLGA